MGFDLDALISFCGWAGLTFVWANVNMTFVTAIGKAIQKLNDEIREKEQRKHEAIKRKAFREGWIDCKEEMEIQAEDES